MKKIFVFLFCFIFFISLNAQIVNIPDTTFKSVLINTYLVDTNNDGDIQVSEAQAVTQLDVSNSAIFDLTGIEEFVNLTDLNCSENGLISLNVSTLTQLQVLNCSSNMIGSLDLSNCANLTDLNCDYNPLSDLDLSYCPQITTASCVSGTLERINANNCSLLNTLYYDVTVIKDFFCVNCSSYANVCVFVAPLLDSVDISGTAITSIYFNSTPSLNYLSVRNCNSLTEIDISKTNLTTLDASNLPVLTNLFCDSSLISRLNLANCPNFTNLYWNQNQFTSLNLSNCIALTSYLFLLGNTLDSLDISGSGVTYVDVQSTSLDFLNVSNCANLTHIDCSNSQLTNLDLTGLSALTELICSNNQLAQLDLSNLPALYDIFCENNLLTNIDVSQNANIGLIQCAGNPLEKFNAANCANLTDIDIFSVYPPLPVPTLKTLNLSNCSSLQLAIMLSPSSSYPIMDSINISGSAIPEIYCDTTSLDFLAFANCANLASIACRGNNLSNLDFTGLPSLVAIHCNDNQLTQLNMSNCASSFVLECENNLITNLDISNTNIGEIYCNGNPVEKLNASNCHYLTRIDLFHPIIYPVPLAVPTLKSLNLSNCTSYSSGLGFIPSSGFPLMDSIDISGSSILDISCDLIGLDFLNVSNCQNLFFITCTNNNLINLDASGLSALSSINCSNNNLSNLDVTGLSALTFMDCSLNNLSNLDVTGLSALQSLYCNSNQISNSLDLSSAIYLETLDCTNNAIPSLSLKNNSIEGFVDFGSNPNLTFICADAGQVLDLQNFALQAGMTNVVIDSTCNLPPSGNYNTLTGTIHFDSDNNGCTANDLITPYFNIKIMSATDTLVVSTDSLGNYTAYLDSVAYTLEPQIANAAYFSISPASQVISFPNNNFNTLTQDFCLSAISTVNDLEVNLVPLVVVRPGFPAVYNLIYRNNGNQTLSGSVNFLFDDAKMNIDSASDAGFVQNIGELSWAYSNIAPFEIRNIVIYSTILPPPVNNIGDTLNLSANISPIIGDNSPNDNSVSLAEVLVGAYDPNDKMCVEGEILPSTQLGNYLHYLVRFQNTGNFYAQDVRVVDSINTQQYDLSSLSIINASHNMHAEIVDNKVSFVFENIMLPDSFTNEPESHGYVLFQLKTKSNLAAGTTVSNNAKIYFDFNSPIITNNATTLFSTPISGNNTIITNVSCNGLSNGSAQITPIGGTGTYSVFDATGNNLGSAAVGTPFTFTGLAAGTYHYQIQNMSQIYLDSFVISQPNPIIVVATPVCNAGASLVCAVANGGTIPYTYSWSNGLGSTACQNGLGAGSYAVTVTDANNCQTTQNVNIPTNICGQVVSAPIFQNAAQVSFFPIYSTTIQNETWANDIIMNEQCDTWVSEIYPSNCQPPICIDQHFLGVISRSGSANFTVGVPVSGNNPYTSPLLPSVKDMEVDTANNLYHVGYYQTAAPVGFTPSFGSHNLYIEKLSPTGSLLWDIKSAISSGATQASAIAIKGNNVYVAGYFSDSVSFGVGNTLTAPLANFLVKLTPSGGIQWKRSFQYTDSIAEVIADNNGFIYVTGSFSNTLTIDGNSVSSAGLQDIYLAKFDANGTCVKLVRDGGTGKDIVLDMALKTNGDLAITGSHSTNATFGVFSLANAKSFSATYNNNLTATAAYNLLTYSVSKNKARIDKHGSTYLLNYSIYKYADNGALLWTKTNYLTTQNGGNSFPLVIGISNNNSFSIAGQWDITLALNTLTVDYNTILPDLSNSPFNPSFFATYFDSLPVCSPMHTLEFNYTTNNCSQVQLYTYFSSGAATTYSWYTIDASGSYALFSTQQNPLYAFWGNTTGSQNVALVASNGVASDTVSHVIHFNIPPAITASALSTCNSVTLSVTPDLFFDVNGSHYFNISWSDGSYGSPIQVSAGTYTAYLDDGLSCFVTLPSITIDTTSLALNLNTTDATCASTNNGSACVTVSSGTAPYNYSWSNGQITSCVNNLGAGTYSVNISDANGCTTSQNVTISQPSPLSSVNNSTNVNCNGATTGTACAIVSGGTAPYNYSWSNGQTTNCVNNLGAGTYSVNISDANGCTTSQNVTISQPSPLSSLNNSTNVNCNGATTGTACAIVSGGTTPYNYSWSNGQTTNCVNNLGAGTYSVNISDANGCTTSQNVTISEPSPLSSVNNSTNVNCNGATTGTACAIVSGGTTPYNYSWSNGQTTSCANNLGAGAYSVNISDANGCTSTQNINITQPAPLNVSVNTSTINCSNSACATTTGGTAPYTYLWSNNATTSCINNLNIGNYSVQVADANGCSATQTVNISQSTTLNVSQNVTNVTCNGTNNGAACITVSGGATPYNYAWSNGLGTNNCASNLSAGTYSVNVTDANGCTSTQNISITQPTALNVIANGANGTCTTAGSACAVVSGGTMPYTYLWSNNVTTNCANNLNAGNYSVNVTDANGCQSTKNVIIGQSVVLNVTIATQNITCNGLTNGSACANISSGTPPYNYSWSNGLGTNNCASNLSAGTYSVNVTDVNGCTSTQNISITEPSALALSVVSTNVNDPTLGSATANPSGGTPPYTYYWTTTSTSQQITNLTVGTYAVFITDANGCQISKTIAITNTTNIANAVENQYFTLYPNPNKGDFVLKSFANADYEANISIFDVTGRSVYTQNIILVAQAENPFHLEVSKGVYFLKMETKEGVFYQKFVIE